MYQAVHGIIAGRCMDEERCDKKLKSTKKKHCNLYLQFFHHHPLNVEKTLTVVRAFSIAIEHESNKIV